MKKIKYLFCIFIFVLLYFEFGNALLNSEHLILLQFYQCTGGSTWIDSSGWKEYVNLYDKVYLALFPLKVTGTQMIDANFDWVDEDKNVTDDLKRMIGDFNMTKLIGIGIKDDHISQIILPSNNLTGGYPNFIKAFPKVVDLNLSNNTLSGVLEFDTSHYKYLETFNVSRNNITSKVPNLSSNTIKYIDLSHNHFYGYIPKPIRFPALKTIDLSYNSITGVINKMLVRQQNLTSLDISHNRIIGYIPPLTFSKLKYLIVNNNLLMDNITGSNLLRSSTLEYFNGDNNLIFGFITKKVFSFTRFTFFSIKNNSINDDDVPSIVECFSDRLQFRSDLTNFTPCVPTITKVSNIDVDGGLLTIWGNDLGYEYNKNIAQVTLENNVSCLDLKFLEINQILTCLAPPGYGLHNLTLTFRNYTIIKEYIYQMPSISYISTVTEKDGGIITIEGNEFAMNAPTTVNIGNAICSNVKIISKTELLCLIPPKSNLQIPAKINLTVDNHSLIPNLNFFYTPIDGTFNCTIPSLRTGQINISSLYIDLSETAKVRVGDYMEDCADTIISKENGSAIVICTPPYGSGLNHPVFITLNSITYKTNCLSYGPPIIKRVFGADYERGGIVTILGRRLSSYPEDIDIKIGNRLCKALSQSTDTEINCYVEGNPDGVMDMNQVIVVNISNQASKAPYSDISERCVDNCNYRATNCRSGSCECSVNRNGPYCESDSAKPLYDLGTSFPGFSFRYRAFHLLYYFRIELSEVVEITPSGKIVDRLFFDSNIIWNLNISTTDKLFVYTNKEKNLTVDMWCACDGEMDIWYAGEVVHVPPYAVRFGLTNNNHKFKHKDNKLRISFSVSSPSSPTASKCSEVPILEHSPMGRLRWFTSFFYDAKLFSRVSQRIVLDGVNTQVDAGIRLSSDQYTITLDYFAGSYEKSMHIESDFSLLTNFRYHPEHLTDGCYIDREHIRRPYEFIFGILLILGSIFLLIYLKRVDDQSRQSINTEITSMGRKEFMTPVMTSASEKSYQRYLESIIDELNEDNLGNPICPLNSSFLVNDMIRQKSRYNLNGDDIDNNYNEETNDRYTTSNIKYNVSYEDSESDDSSDSSSNTDTDSDAESSSENDYEYNNNNKNKNNNSASSSSCTNSSGISSDELNNLVNSVYNKSNIMKNQDQNTQQN